MPVLASPRPGLVWALILVAATLAGCGSDARSGDARQSARPEATPVIVASVATARQEDRVEAVGTSQAMRSVTLFPAAAGEVVEIGFEAGQRVESGQVLMRLDRREQVLALELAQLRLADAERLLQRYLGMRGTGAVTSAEIDDARSAVQSADIELRRARVALDDRIVRAPFSGHMGLSELDPGDRIDTDTPIATLDDRSALLVSFEVPEMLVGRLRTGDAISVSSWAAPAASLVAQGRVLDVDSRIQPDTRSFRVRARVDNADDSLRPGMSFRVNLALVGEAFPIVPEASVQWGGDGAYVWRIEDHKAQRIGVGIVQRRQGQVLIDAPLQAGDQVVLEGVQMMREGRVVSFLETDSATGQGLLRQ